MNLSTKPRKVPGERYTTAAYGRAIEYACARAGVKPRNPNQLRHTRTTFLEVHADPIAAQYAAGHASLNTTKVYAHGADTVRRKLVARHG